MSKVLALRNKIRIHEELGEEGWLSKTYRELDLLSQRTYKETCSAMAAELEGFIQISAEDARNTVTEQSELRTSGSKDNYRKTI